MLQLPRAHDGNAREGHRVIDPDSVQPHQREDFCRGSRRRMNIGDAVGVFHHWIKDTVCPEMLIDVAEYSHVPAGPGVMLIAPRSELQFRYAREPPRACSTTARLPSKARFNRASAQAHKARSTACDRLEKEHEASEIRSQQAGSLRERPRFWPRTTKKPGSP